VGTPGQPTKYNEEVAKQFAEYLSYMKLEDACAATGISEQTYYNWLYLHPRFFELSREARLTRAVYHFDQAQEMADLAKKALLANDKDLRADLLKISIDTHIRLAGKANQGLFGDKQKDDNDKSITIIANNPLIEEKKNNENNKINN
jgi:hypothetical protein